MKLINLIIFVEAYNFSITSIMFVFKKSANEKTEKLCNLNNFIKLMQCTHAVKTKAVVIAIII